MNRHRFAVTLLLLVIGGALSQCGAGENKIPPPARPVSVPVTAVWSGGGDGGIWLQCDSVSSDGRQAWCRIFFDADGDLWEIGSFKSDTYLLTSESLIALFAGYDGSRILLSNGHSLLNMNEFVKLDIYYCEWQLVTRLAWGCMEIRTNGEFMSTVDPAAVRRVAHSLRRSSWHPLPEFRDIDARICCELLDTSGIDRTTIEFSRTSIMRVNGVIYETDSALFGNIVSLLPDGYYSR